MFLAQSACQNGLFLTLDDHLGWVGAIRALPTSTDKVPEAAHNIHPEMNIARSSAGVLLEV
jgi:hypothetical protein